MVSQQQYEHTHTIWIRRRIRNGIWSSVVRPMQRWCRRNNNATNIENQSSLIKAINNPSNGIMCSRPTRRTKEESADTLQFPQRAVFLALRFDGSIELDQNQPIIAKTVRAKESDHH